MHPGPTIEACGGRSGLLHESVWGALWETFIVTTESSSHGRLSPRRRRSYLRIALLATAALLAVGAVRLWAYDAPAGACFLLVVTIATAAEGLLNRSDQERSTPMVVLGGLGVLVLIGLVWYVIAI